MKRILVRYDRDGWAFHRRAEGFKMHRPLDWAVEIAPDSNPMEGPTWDGVLMLDCQADVSLFRKFRAKVVKHIGSHAWMFDADKSDWRTRGVNSYRCAGRVESIVSNADTVIVHNRAQRDFFSGFHSDVILAPYTVDCRTFKNPGRRNHAKPKIGWNQQVSGGMNSFKGLSDILVQVVAGIGSRADWSVLTPDAVSAMDTRQIVQWYQSLDIYLVTSSAEGGPHGPFEAAACGCAVVSTDVGQVSDWDCLRGLGLIVPTYRNAAEARETVDAMIQQIESLMRNPWIAADKLSNDIRENWSAAKEVPQQLRAMFGG